MSNAKRLSQIFISYRRDDSAAITGRIYDRLIQRFGREAVFKDVDSIPLGTNFKRYLDSVIAQCGVVLVVIGDRWESIADKHGNKLLHKQGDFVRIEIESALQRDIPIIPLLVQGASIPVEANLPPTIAELVYRNGIEIGHDPHFHTDVNRLISHLETLLSSGQTSSGSSVSAPSRGANKTPLPQDLERDPTAIPHPDHTEPTQPKHSVAKPLERNRRGIGLAVAAGILFVLWMLGLIGGFGGALIHILLLIALVLIIIFLIRKLV